MNAREALDRIAALLEQSDRTGWDIETEQVRAVLAEVTPEPGGGEGRDWIGNPDGTLVYWQREAEEARARAVSLPNPGDTVRWLGEEYLVVGVMTRPAVILEHATGYRQTVSVDALDRPDGKAVRL